MRLRRKASNVARTRHTFNAFTQTMFQQGKTLLSSLVAFLLALCLALLPGCALWGGAGAGGTASAGGSANGTASAAASGDGGADGSEASVAGGSAAAADAGAAEAGDGGQPGGLGSSGAGGSDASAASGVSVSKDGAYTDRDHVALYLHLYQTLPANFISKTKAKKAGWDAEKGNLWDVCPGKSIGGGTFYNDDGLLPEKSGRTWKECDIDYAGGYRGAKRICYSNDGLIFYTDDHYQSFTQLY